MGPLRKPAADRRREIADAALRVIATQGLGRFTSLAIAHEVGVSDGALFRHFPSKDAIVGAAIDRAEELLFEGVPAEDDDPVTRLGAFFRHRVAVIREHPGISTLVATDELAKAGAPGGPERVARFRRRSLDFVRSCLEEASGRRLLAPGLGLEEASVVVLGALVSLVHFTIPGRGAVTASLAPRVWSALETFLRGSQARAPTPLRRTPPRTRRKQPPTSRRTP